MTTIKNKDKSGYAGDCKDYDPCMIDVLADPQDTKTRLCITCCHAVTEDEVDRIVFIKCEYEKHY